MSSQQRPPVPPPKNVPYLEQRSTTLKKLREAMGPPWDSDSFPKFCLTLRGYAADLDIDGLTRCEHIDQTKWTSLANKVAGRFPDLNRYQAKWPITIYYNRLVADRKYHAKVKANKKSQQDAEHRQRDRNSDPQSPDENDDDVPLRLRTQRGANTSRPQASSTRSPRNQHAHTFILPSSNARRDPTNTQPASAKSAPQDPNAPRKRPRGFDSDSDSDKLDDDQIHTKRRARSSSSSSSSSSNQSNPSFPTPAQRPRIQLEEIPAHNAPPRDAKGTRYYIGKNPINYKRPQAKRKAPTVKKVVLSDDESDDDFDVPRRATQGTPGQSSQGASSSASGMGQSSQDTFSQPATDLSADASVDVHTLTDWPIFCVFCGAPPVVAPRYTTELRGLLSPGAPAVLATMGILHDLHLRILATCITPAQRRDFLLSAVTKGRCTQFEALEMTSALDSFGEKITERGENLPGDSIEVCIYHGDNHAVAVPPELARALQELGMEELGPAAVFLGISSDARFRDARKFDEDVKRVMLFENMKGIEPSAFQKMMLEIVLSAPV
ncbi:hypothetical protein C8F04DRAFT_218557 [Mycena alexandri]|uniref:ARID domain-containing protein n=1 Tax=Mycena alexandri TaxID=1745969 RepID=A0AAD6XG94_9AGAR|nr:hypothetical protein C8F04DRAFT_218557 [Mycena alexandri]